MRSSTFFHLPSVMKLLELRPFTAWLSTSTLSSKQPCSTMPQPRSGLFWKFFFSAAVESPITNMVVILLLEVSVSANTIHSNIPNKLFLFIFFFGSYLIVSTSSSAVTICCSPVAMFLRVILPAFISFSPASAT